ncbi:hypothetical protein GCM10009872_46610 [Actinopolymorpha rutila]
MDFVLHGQAGTASVTHRLNDQPAAVGFDLLGIDFGDLDFSGFPVVEATTSYEGQGYRALMGWLQVVRYTSPNDGEMFIVDTGPQFRGIAGMDFPFLSWGMRPTLFDAPAIVESSVDWWADSFLVATPDALMTPIIEPLCAFRWGYAVDDDGVVTSRPPRARPTAEAWAEVRDGVQKLHPGWTLR